MKYYAVGFKGGTIELRESETPLKKVVSTFNKPYSVYNRYSPSQTVKGTIRFDVHAITGGTVIGTIDHTRFFELLLAGPPPMNEVKEITASQLQTILRRVRKFKDDPRRQRKTRVVQSPRTDRTNR